MDALRRAELEKRGDGGEREQPATEARDPASPEDLDAPAPGPARDLDTTQALPEDIPFADDEDSAAAEADADASGPFAGLTLSLEAIDDDEQDDPDDSGAKRRASLLGAGGGTSLGTSSAVAGDPPSVQAERPEAVAAATRGEPVAGDRDDSPTVASATSANAALRSFFDDGDTFDGTRSRPFAAEELELPLSDTSQVTAETLFEAGRSGPGRMRVAGLVAASVGFALAFVAAVGFYYYQLTPTPQAPLPVAELPPSRPPAPSPPAQSFTAETEVEAPSAAPPTAPEDTAAAEPEAVAAPPAAKPAEPSPAPNPNAAGPDSEAGEGQRQPAEPDPLAHPALPGAPAPIAERAGGALRAARSSDLNGLLERAYADFGAGRLASAERRYRQVLDVVPAQRDATLGLAAIAERRGDLGAAFERYAAVLERHPGDEVAIAALFRLSDGADAVANPARLKVLLDDAEEPAPLWYALGRHYARRSDWRQAQEAFFNAFRSARDRADYAYNLAVALDRLGQSAAAVDYYQKALSLAGSGSASFSGDVVRARLAALREAADARR